jgi:hypothetical protein
LNQPLPLSMMGDINIAEANSVNTANRKKNIWILTPLFGTLLYVLLYFVASLFYPGGSQFDKNSNGFSWAQNYWCNLLNESAINGQPNHSRPIALVAMIVLCLTLIIFWWQFPKHVEFKKNTRLIIQISGFASMTLGLFLFSDFHDIAINIATLLGLVAMTGTFLGLVKLRWKKLFWMGVINIVLVVANNILYYNSGLIHLLPIVQKITFVYFLLWICLISLNLFRRQKN